MWEGRFEGTFANQLGATEVSFQAAVVAGACGREWRDWTASEYRPPRLQLIRHLCRGLFAFPSWFRFAPFAPPACSNLANSGPGRFSSLISCPILCPPSPLWAIAVWKPTHPVSIRFSKEDNQNLELVQAHCRRVYLPGPPRVIVRILGCLTRPSGNRESNRISPRH